MNETDEASVLMELLLLGGRVWKDSMSIDGHKISLKSLKC